MREDMFLIVDEVGDSLVYYSVPNKFREMYEELVDSDFEFTMANFMEYCGSSCGIQLFMEASRDGLFFRMPDFANFVGLN